MTTHHTDESSDALLGQVLRWGMLLSAVVVVCGGLAFLAHNGAQRPDYRVFKSEPDALRAIDGIVAEALALRDRGLIQFGLLLLIATPIARVASSVVGFVRQRDWLYVGITLVVLGLLAYSLTRG